VSPKEEGIVKAIETVMPGHYSPEEFYRLNKQAEISFKAGQDSRLEGSEGVVYEI
jgi:hypothetical protein